MIDLEPALKKGKKEFEKLYRKAEKLINEEIKNLPANKNLNLYAGITEKIIITFKDCHNPVRVIKELIVRLNMDYKFSFRQITNGFVIYINKCNVPEKQQQLFLFLFQLVRKY